MRGYMSKKSLPTAQSGGFFIRRRIEERLPQDAQGPDRQDSRSPCARRGAGPDRTVHPATTPRRAGNVPRQNGRRPLPAHTNLRPPAYRRRICHRTTAAAAVALPSAVRTKPSPSGKERKAHRPSPPPDSGEEKAPRFADILDQPCLYLGFGAHGPIWIFSFLEGIGFHIQMSDPRHLGKSGGKRRLSAASRTADKDPRRLTSLHHALFSACMRVPIKE